MKDENRTFLRSNRYSIWEKSFLERKFSFMPIIEFHLKRAFKKRLAKYLLILCTIITLFFLLTIIFDEIKDMDIAQTGSISVMIDFVKEIGFLSFGKDLFYWYIYSLLFIWFLLFVIYGSEIISMDRKYNAVVLYLTRPLDIHDYIAGKLLSLVIFILLTGFAPVILMFLTKLAVSQDIGLIFGSFFLFLRIFIFFAFYSVFLASLILSVSCIMKSSRMVIIVIFALYFFSGIASGIFAGIAKATKLFPAEYSQLLSVNGLIQASLKALVKYESFALGSEALIAMVLISFSALLIIRSTIRRSV